LHAKGLPFAIGRDGLAFDVLHGEVAEAVPGCSAVEEDGYILMLEAGMEFLLLSQPPGQDLQGDSPGNLAVFRKVHPSHAAFAERPGDAVVSDYLAFRKLRPSQAGRQGLVVVEEVGAGGRDGEKGFNFAR